MHILVTGSQGQLAQAMRAAENPGIAITTLGRPDLDITDAASIARAIANHRPDIVVNAAAYTAVDKAESEAEAAFAINRDGAGNVARAAFETGLPVIQISTDYVFPGDKTAPYLEADATGPTGVYGRSKLAGEEAVAAANPRHVILRTAWVYSRFGANFVRTMLRLAADREMVRVVADQHGTPTHAPDIAAGIIAVSAHVLKHPHARDWRGVFHMVSKGETTWAGFAREIFDQSARLGGPSARVEPISTADYPTPARRPANSRLDISRFTATFGHTLPHWSAGVPETVQALLNR